MAENMRLTDGSETVDFSPVLDPAYNRPDNRKRAAFTASDKTKQWIDWGGKRKDSLTINDMTKTDADKINTWWSNLTMLTYTPDLTAPGTTVYVKLGNEQQPMQMWFDTDWQQKYTGTLILNEVSSSSSGS